MKTIIKTIKDYIQGMDLPLISEFREVQLFNKMYKANLFTLRKQLDNIVKFKDEQKKEVCPIIEAIIRQSKNKDLYEYFKENILPNKKGEYSSHKILMFIHKNKENLQTTFLTK